MRDFFKEAQVSENAELRQEFLDSIDLEIAKPYVSKVLYVPSQKRLATMVTLQNLLTRFSLRGFRSKILVYPWAFDKEKSKHEKLDDILGTLIDHEGFHAKEFFELKHDFSWLTVYSMLTSSTENFWDSLYLTEIRAYQNTLANPSKRDFSDAYVERIRKNCESYVYAYSRSTEKIKRK